MPWARQGWPTALALLSILTGLSRAGADVVEAPPVSGPLLVLSVPERAIAVSASSDCSATNNGSGVTEMFSFPETSGVPRRCIPGSEFYNAGNALWESMYSTNPERAWKTVSGDRNASLSLALSQSLSVVAVHFALHTPVPEAIVMRGIREDAEQSQVLLVAVRDRDDCERVFNVPRDDVTSNAYPQCYWLSGLLDENEDTIYPIHIDLPVVIMPNRADAVNASYLESLTFQEVVIDILGIPGNTTNSTFLAVSDLQLRGRCQCSGHAAECSPTTLTPPLPFEPEEEPGPRRGRRSTVTTLGNSTDYYVCEPCLHQTTGVQCDRCSTGFTARNFSRAQPCMSTILLTGGLSNISIVTQLGREFEIRPALSTGIPPEISWYKDDVPITASDRFQILPGALRVIDVVPVDAGYYEGRLVNDGGVTEVFGAVVCIQSQRLPEITLPRGNMRVVYVGGTVTLQCRVVSSPDTDVTWSTTFLGPITSEMPGVTINQTDQLIDNGQQRVYHSTLTRSGVRIEDSGVYLCRASILLTECMESVFETSVGIDVFICRMSDPITRWNFFKSQPIILWVALIGCPKPPVGTSVQWSFSNTLLDPSNVSFSTAGSNFSARLPDLPIGVYNATFKLLSADDTVVQNINMTITVAGPPVLRRIGRERITAITGGRPGLITLAFAIVEPALTPLEQYYSAIWTHNGGSLMNGGSNYEEFASGTLLIIKPLLLHAGIYTVTVGNRLGEDSLSYTLDVYIPPTFLGFQQLGGTVLPTLTESVPLNITCEAMGIPLPDLTIRTTDQIFQLGLNRNGIIISRTTAQLVTGEFGVRLTFYNPDAMALDQERLFCLAQSEAGSARATIVSPLRVLGAPGDIQAALILPQAERHRFTMALNWRAAETTFANVTHQLCYRRISTGVAANPTVRITEPAANPGRPGISGLVTTERQLTLLTGSTAQPSTLSGRTPTPVPIQLPTARPGPGDGEEEGSTAHPLTLSVSNPPPVPVQPTMPRPGPDDGEEEGEEIIPTLPVTRVSESLPIQTPAEEEGLETLVPVRPSPGPGDGEEKGEEIIPTLPVSRPESLPIQTPAEEEGEGEEESPATKQPLTRPPPTRGKRHSEDEEEEEEDVHTHIPDASMNIETEPGQQSTQEVTDHSLVFRTVAPSHTQPDRQTADPLPGGAFLPIQTTQPSTPSPSPNTNVDRLGPMFSLPSSDGPEDEQQCVFIHQPTLLTVNNENMLFGALLRGLVGYSTYAFAALAIAEPSYGPLSETYYITTPPSRPYPPEDLTVVEVGAFHVYLRWLPPTRFVGPILNYTVSLSGVFRVLPTQLSRTVQAPPFNASVPPAQQREPVYLNYTGLFPSLRLTITVTPSTAAGPGDSAKVSANTPGAVLPPTIPTNVRSLDPEQYRSLIPERFRLFGQSMLTWRVDEFQQTDRTVHFYQILVVKKPNNIAIFSETAESSFPIGSANIRSYDEVQNSQPGELLAYIAGELQTDDFLGGIAYFSGGVANRTSSLFLEGSFVHNGPLEAGTTYNAFVRAFVRRSQSTRGKRQQLSRLEDFDVVTGPFLFEQQTSEEPSPAPSSSSESSTVGAIIGGVFAILAIIIVVIGVIFLKNFERGQKLRYQISIKRRASSHDLASPTKSKARTPSTPAALVMVNPLNQKFMEDSMDTSTVTTSQSSASHQESELDRMKRFSSTDFESEYKRRKPIAVEHFSRYVERQRKNECFRFEREYEILTKRSPLLDAVYSQRPEVEDKNRYANVFAADDTRVVLPRVDDKPGSDYINANYIDGFECKREYIATQGPQGNTCDDFWCMVWKDNVKTITMLTRLEERAKVKCNQYWPNTGTRCYGDISVTASGVKETSDYTIRTFKLVKSDLPESELVGTERIVTQFHFTSWPDYGVPLLTAPLLSFLRRVRHHQPHNSCPGCPIVMHCSAGIGRTGTLIAIDSQLRQAHATGALDPYTYVLGMRGQRSTMVQTKEQYFFLHCAIQDAVHYGSTAVGGDGIAMDIEDCLTMDSGTSCNAFSEFELLQSSDFKLPLKQGTLIKDRTRTSNIPYNHNRVRLQPIPGVDGSDYINASYIDSWNTRQGFITAETPTKKTSAIFWNMIWRERVCIIVAMETGDKKDDCAVYWPKVVQKSLLLETYSVNLVSSEAVLCGSDTSKTAAVQRLTLQLSHEQFEEERNLIIYHVPHWTATDVQTYPNPADVLMMLSAVQSDVAEAESAAPVLLHCRDGSSLCGTLVSVAVCLEHYRDVQQIDVLQAVLNLRAQRMGTVPSKELYRYIYECLRVRLMP